MKWDPIPTDPMLFEEIFFLFSVDPLSCMIYSQELLVPGQERFPTTPFLFVVVPNHSDELMFNFQFFNCYQVIEKIMKIIVIIKIIL